MVFMGGSALVGGVVEVRGQPAVDAEVVGRQEGQALHVLAVQITLYSLRLEETHDGSWCTSEQVRAGLPQLDGLFVELASAAVGVGGDPLPHGLDAVLVVRVEEDDDGVPLGVVQGVHRLGRHVQQGVLILGGVGQRRHTVMVRKEYSRAQTCSEV
ncbi:hypothetical protein EYF80_022089 [Liparis tanakae]|uniref:Uncharacterized protein n=1 Tax=Liparis tanakae TaxID=230148 RepID=A0A4Z2HQQ1_9TELE|nr:hypothetical protein EYF80_022089 [Liparis tanakae]